MRFASVLAISLLCASSALGQSAPASSSQAVTASQTASADVPPTHPITREQVDEILELSHSQELAKQVMQRMMSSLGKAFPPFMPKDVIAEIEHGLENINFEPMAVQAYQKHVSTEDAAKIIAFYKTPAGQRLVSVTPAITREMQLGGAQEGQQIVRQIIEKHMDEIKAAAKQYQQEHAGPPTVITPN
jgi:uncharacterized protein